MKLTYLQLETHLAQKLSPVYIISGDEILLKQDCINWVRKTAKLAGFSERMRLTEIKDGEELYTLLYSTSLLAQKRLLELDFRSNNPNKIINQILQEYGSNLPQNPDTLLLIDIGKIDSKVAKQTWYQTLEKIGCAVAIWPIPRAQLPQWINARVKKYKLQFTAGATNFLADYVEGNLIAASQAIEKIYLLKPQNVVDETLISNVLTDESTFTIFDLSENLIAGNKKKCLHILEKLRIDGIEPTLILWSIMRELRLLVELAEQLKQGHSYDTLFQKHKVFSRLQPAMRQFLSRHHANDCYDYLVEAARIDQMIKGALVGNVWNALQIFCLRF